MLLVLSISMFWTCVFTFVMVINPIYKDPLEGIPREIIPQLPEIITAWVSTF